MNIFNYKVKQTNTFNYKLILWLPLYFLIAIVSKGDTTVREIADHVIEIPNSDEFIVPILATIPFQLISYHIAVMRECNVDQPRNLAKSVTVE